MVISRDLGATLTLFDRWAGLELRERGIPGLAAGLVHGGGLAWGRAYGLADVARRTPVTLDTRFRIASVTKLLTAVAILQLRDAGRLHLDDPVARFLPWFAPRNGAVPVTIRHLLTHTSGLPRDATVPHWTEDEFQTWEEIVRAAPRRVALDKPLARFSFSNYGFALLGGVVEAASGLSWEQHVRERILDPLEMHDTIVTPSGYEPDCAMGYLARDEAGAARPVPFIATRGFTPSAGVASTVNDLARFAAFSLGREDSPVLSAYSLREMYTIQWLQPDWKNGCGLGTDIFRCGEWTVGGHDGGYKGFLSSFMVIRDRGVGAIVLANSLAADPHRMAERLLSMAVPYIDVPGRPATEPRSEWSRFTGAYHNDWGEMEVVIRGGRLQAVPLRFADAPAEILEPTDDPCAFTIVRDGHSGDKARFELDVNGDVQKLWMGSEYVLPRRA